MEHEVAIVSVEPLTVRRRSFRTSFQLVRSILKKCFQSVELLVLLSVSAQSATCRTYTQQVLQRVCSYDLQLNSTVKCPDNFSLLNNNNVETSSIAAYLLRWSLLSSALEAVPGIIIASFVGSWSDNFGRKPAIVCFLIGSVANALLQLWFVADTGWPPYFALVQSAFAGVFASTPVFLSCCLAFVADSTSSPEKFRKYRALRLVLIVACSAIGSFAGSILEFYVVDKQPALAIFIGSIVVHILALLYCLVCVVESRRTRLRQQIEVLILLRYQPNTENVNAALVSFGIAFLHLFALKNVYDFFQLLFRRRPHCIRILIWLLFWAMLFSSTALSYEKIPFIPAEGYISVINCSVNLFLPMILPLVIIVSSGIRVRDPLLLLLGAVANTALVLVLWLNVLPNLNIIFMLASEAIKRIGMYTIPVCLSRLVGRGEQGRAFALLAMTLCLAPLAARAVALCLQLYPNIISRNILSIAFHGSALWMIVIVSGCAFPFYGRQQEEPVSATSSSTAHETLFVARDSIASATVLVSGTFRPRRSINFRNFFRSPNEETGDVDDYLGTESQQVKPDSAGAPESISAHLRHASLVNEGFAGRGRSSIGSAGMEM